MEIYHQTTIKVLPQAVKTGLCALHKKMWLCTRLTCSLACCHRASHCNLLRFRKPGWRSIRMVVEAPTLQVCNSLRMAGDSLAGLQAAKSTSTSQGCFQPLINLVSWSPSHPAVSLYCHIQFLCLTWRTGGKGLNKEKSEQNDPVAHSRPRTLLFLSPQCAGMSLGQFHIVELEAFLSDA